MTLVGTVGVAVALGLTGSAGFFGYILARNALRGEAAVGGEAVDGVVTLNVWDATDASSNLFVQYRREVLQELYAGTNTEINYLTTEDLGVGVGNGPGVVGLINQYVANGNTSLLPTIVLSATFDNESPVGSSAARQLKEADLLRPIPTTKWIDTRDGIAEAWRSTGVMEDVAYGYPYGIVFDDIVLYNNAAYASNSSFIYPPADNAEQIAVRTAFAENGFKECAFSHPGPPTFDSTTAGLFISKVMQVKYIQEIGSSPAAGEPALSYNNMAALREPLNNTRILAACQAALDDLYNIPDLILNRPGITSTPFFFNPSTLQSGQCAQLQFPSFVTAAFSSVCPFPGPCPFEFQSFGASLDNLATFSAYRTPGKAGTPSRTVGSAFAAYLTNVLPDTIARRSLHAIFSEEAFAERLVSKIQADIEQFRFNQGIAGPLINGTTLYWSPNTNVDTDLWPEFDRQIMADYADPERVFQDLTDGMPPEFGGLVITGPPPFPDGPPFAEGGAMVKAMALAVETNDCPGPFADAEAARLAYCAGAHPPAFC